jgi:hypothetical protein
MYTWNKILILKLVQLKAGLHYGDYRSKLVHFESQKKYFLCLKKAELRPIFTVV